MAPKQKRHSHMNDPHPTETKEDREPSHADDEQEGDNDQEKYQLSLPAPINPSLSKLHSSSSDSDSEPENPNATPNPKAKLLPSKPKEQAPNLIELRSSSSEAKQVKPPSKRPAENNVRSPDPKHAKKKKKVEAEDAPASEENEEEKKSSRFQRLFSEEDEVAILEGMLEFRSAMGGDDPYKCADAFHDFMKSSKRISFEPSSVQLKEKIRKLKSKFKKNDGKEKNGEIPRFSKPNVLRAFELSQAIWGQGAGGGDGVNDGALEKAKPDDGKVGKKTANCENAEKLKPGPAKAKLEYELQLLPVESKELGKDGQGTEEGVGLGSMNRYDTVLSEHGLGDNFLRKGDGLMEASKRAEFEGKWLKLEAAESELRVKRSELYANHAKSMLQAIKLLKN